MCFFTGETIANLQIRASDRVYWSGQGRPPPGWDPKAYTDAIYNPPNDTANLDNPSTASGQGAEAVDGTSFSGENSIAPIGGLLSRAAAVSNLLQIPLTLLKKVSRLFFRRRSDKLYFFKINILKYTFITGLIWRSEHICRHSCAIRLIMRILIAQL